MRLHSWPYKGRAAQSQIYHNFQAQFKVHSYYGMCYIHTAFQNEWLIHALNRNTITLRLVYIPHSLSPYDTAHLLLVFI